MKPFLRLTRADLREMLDAQQATIDEGVRSKRALRDKLTDWLESRAEAYERDAEHLERKPGSEALSPWQRRAIAVELRSLAAEVEGVR